MDLFSPLCSLLISEALLNSPFLNDTFSTPTLPSLLILVRSVCLCVEYTHALPLALSAPLRCVLLLLLWTIEYNLDGEFCRVF